MPEKTPKSYLPKSNTLTKGERLVSKKQIQLLFQTGFSFAQYPYKILYLEFPNKSFESSTQIIVSIPKKRFKRAVQRNLLKRRIKEAYRLNKNFLQGPSNYIIAFIYIANEPLLFNVIEKKLILALKRLANKGSLLEGV